MTDIVKRLREEANDAFTKAWHTGNGQVCEDAADEIVHLRSTIALMKPFLPAELLERLEDSDDD